jgi:hypothetical protein
LCSEDANELDVVEIDKRLGTVADNARCNLALQHQIVVESIRRAFSDNSQAHVTTDVPAVVPELIAPIVDIEDGRAVLDEHQLRKQPDWTFDDADSGKWPATRLDHRSTEAFE